MLWPFLGGARTPGRASMGGHIWEAGQLLEGRNPRAAAYELYDLGQVIYVHAELKNSNNIANYLMGLLWRVNDYTGTVV